MANWIDETELPSEIKKIGNTEVKTDKDVLNVPVTIRCSANHKQMIKEILKGINDKIKPPAKKIKAADVWRMALEGLYTKSQSED